MQIEGHRMNQLKGCPVDDSRPDDHDVSYRDKSVIFPLPTALLCQLHPSCHKNISVQEGV